ncbi:putative membrane protein [Fodinibius salinus]|uniref:Putative membrane protein n=1 Tax=Fodinibius salinus TaxID=860790 RepID=A0A5D3YHU8_9BACT|nr:SdpI family protein [Fodinibius salinus]TYP91705.1 putative membrane protein [Fodinibius salinus]
MNTLTYAFKKEWYNILLVLLPFALLPFIWDQLPARIAIQWNFQGEVSGYGSKTFGSLITPVTNIFIYAVLLYLPKIDPKKRITIDQKPIPVLRTACVVFLVAIQGWILINALGYTIPSQGILFLGIAVFFLIFGNYLRIIKPNYFIGIRVPWALEDADNWRQTHRIGSYIWVSGGLLLIILYPFFELQTYSTLFTIITVLLALIPAGYSFYLYQKSN